MSALVPDLLSLLRAHPLVQSLRVVHHDETPLGYVATHPHHFHNEAGDVGTSPLRGDPIVDLPHVLAEIEKWMASH
jgi:hypothetical protein